MSIAGVDPSAGAGLLADIKTFEQHKVYGLGISTAQTLQTEDCFFSIRWEKDIDIIQSIEKMLSYYDVKAVKIGIVQGLEALEKIVTSIHNTNKDIKIIIDPVIRSSSGYNFWNDDKKYGLLARILKMSYLITPNFDEVIQLVDSSEAKEAAKKISSYCNVLLKGGHNIQEPGVDYLFLENEMVKFDRDQTVVFAKHGSGCVLSSAITANLALGDDLVTACKKAKLYTTRFLSVNTTLLSYHHV